MASNYDNELLIASHEADSGCFEHFRCFCAIREDFEKLKVRLGPNFEAFWRYFCSVCATTPPRQPDPPQIGNQDPPVLTPLPQDPEVTLTPRSCALPDPGRY